MAVNVLRCMESVADKGRMNVGHWWNNTDSGKLKTSDKNILQLRCLHHKFDTDCSEKVTL